MENHEMIHFFRRKFAGIAKWSIFAFIGKGPSGAAPACIYNARNMERTTDTLARYTIYAAVAVAAAAVCWFLRDVIIYILLAGVLSLTGLPLMKLFGKIKIRGKGMPDWLCAIFSISLILGALFSVVTLAFPILFNVVKDISVANMGDTMKSVSVPLANFNAFLIEKFPNLGSGFRIEDAILGEIRHILDLETLSSLFSSATSFLTSFGVGLFSVVFISFFFFKDESLFTRIVMALVPDSIEGRISEAIEDIRNLLTRYFIGLLTEVAGVALLNFLGLLFIARMGVNASLGIAFLAGILNIIPYVGPLTGGLLGTTLAVILKYMGASGLGIDVGFWAFILIVAAIFAATQIADNFLFQPIIYSSSIKAHPLEIFIVLLIAGNIGGIAGMLVAIPSYTVIRVIAGKFFRRVKFIRKLIPDEKDKNNI